MTEITPAEKMRVALDMYEIGEAMQRARLRREDPEATDTQIDEALAAWRRHRPGAEHGDSAGQPSRRFE